MIGLTIVLFLTWRALEYKGYDTNIDDVVISDTSEPDLHEEVPITKVINLLPTPATPTIIEIVEDVIEIEETIIQSTEINLDAEVAASILDVDDMEVAEVEKQNEL